ncbi:MAG: hypothetical protein ACRD96_03525, partial [Bryobacteraceae bacterium]
MIPYAVLLAEVLLFYWRVLFAPSVYAIPWDLRYYHLPLAEFMAASYRAGELPLWDPWTYCGFPYFANVTAQFFYPPTIVTVLLSNLEGGGRLLYFLEVQLVAHVLLAGAGMYRLLRRLEAGPAAAILGATVYQLGPFFASQAQHIGAINAAAWLPLAFLAVVERRIAMLAASLAMAILAGFPAVAASSVVACGMLAAALVALGRAPVKTFATLAAGVAWAGLLAAAQVFPTMQLTRLSVSKYRGDWLDTGGGMPLQSLISLALPNYYGSFQFNGTTWNLPWNPTWLYLYVGIGGLACVAAALGNRRAAPYGIVTLLGSLWMLGDNTPVGRGVFAVLPEIVKAPLYAEYALPIYSAGMAVLAGLGAQRLMGARPAALQAAAVAVVAGELIAVGSGRPMN